MDLISTSQKTRRGGGGRRRNNIPMQPKFEGTLFLFQNIGRIQNLSLNDEKYIGTKFSEDKIGHH